MMRAQLVPSAPRTPAPDVPQSVYAVPHRPCGNARSELPPLDRTGQPADADRERVQEFIRRQLASSFYCPVCRVSFRAGQECEGCALGRAA
jgi:hypothetical protein